MRRRPFQTHVSNALRRDELVDAMDALDQWTRDMVASTIECGRLQAFAQHSAWIMQRVDRDDLAYYAQRSLEIMQRAGLSPPPGATRPQAAGTMAREMA